MRTLLTGEFAQAIRWDSDYYVKVETQNASGTWIDVGASLGRGWVVEARWSETIDQPVSSMTIRLVPIVAGTSMSPLIAASPLNVDDHGAYAPLLEIGRLVRVNVATMAEGVALDVSKYREVFIGRVDTVDESDSNDGQQPITLTCSDLGAWLMDIEIESTTDRQYGTATPPGTPLETVLQDIINDNIPAGEPAVTLYKQSSSTFAVTPLYTQGQDKLLTPLVNLVLDTTGEDLRYRYDASHVSRLTWFNPDRSRSTVDATFDVNGYAVQKLDRSLDVIRNAGRIPSPQTVGTYVSNTSTTLTIASIADYRRHFMQLPASPQLTTDAQALAIIDAAINDLCGAPIDASILHPFLWFVQLYDRYTYPANGRQYDSDQTLCVVGFEHSITSGKGRTTLTLTGRVVGAYAAWRKRIVLGNPAAGGPTVTVSLDDSDDTGADVTINAQPGAGVTMTPQVSYRLSDDAGAMGLYTAFADAPLSVRVTYLAKNNIVIQPRALQSDGQITEGAGFPLRGHLPAVDPTTGHNKRTVPLDDGGYAATATSSDGYNLDANVQTSVGSLVSHQLSKASASDPNTADAVPDGLSKRVPTLNEATGGGRAIVALDTGNRLVTSVAEGATIGVESAAVISKKQGGYYRETFNVLPDANNWNFSNLGTLSLVTGQSLIGAYVLRSNGFTWMSTPRMPFNPNALYRFRVRMRCINDSTGGQVCYVGCLALLADGTPANNNGGWSYVVAEGLALAVADGWVELTTWVKGASVPFASGSPGPFGTDATIPQALNVGVAFISPLIAVGYPGGAGVGTYEVDYFIIDEYDEDASGRTYAGLATSGDVQRHVPLVHAVANIPSLDGTTGHVKRGVTLDDGSYAVKASANDGTIIDSAVAHSAGALVSRQFSKSTSSDPNTADAVTDGLSKRVTTLAEATGGGRAVVAIDSGNVVVAAAVDLARSYTGKHLGNIPDDAGSDRRAATANEKTGAGRGFSALDSNSRLADQSRNVMLAGAGVSALQSTNLILSCTGSSGNWTISIAAHAVQFGFGQVSYNSGSVHVTFNDTTFFIYVTDPTFAGGAVTYLAVEPVQFLDVASDQGNYYVGAIRTPASSGSSTGSTGGSGSSGGYQGPTPV